MNIYLESKMKEIDERLDFNLKIMNENTKSDPPVFIMNDTMFEVAELLSEDYTRNQKLSETGSLIQSKFYQMMDVRLNQLVAEERGLNAQELANYFNEKLGEMREYKSLGDDNMQKLMNRICIANLKVHQKIRDINKSGDKNALVYNEVQEYLDIAIMLETTTSLSGASQRLLHEINDASTRTLDGFNEARQSRELRSRGSR